MDRETAEELISSYRARVRFWSLAMLEAQPRNVRDVERWLDARRGTLEQIAVEHPVLAHSAMVLSKFRERVAGDRKELQSTAKPAE